MALVRIHGLPQLRVKLAEIETRMELASPVAVAKAADVLARQMRSSAPVRTGKLRAAISTSVTSMGDGATARTGSNVPYDPFVQKGTVYMEPQPYGEEAAHHGAAEIVAVMAAVYKAALPR